jgi:hypothetical protein
MLATLSSTSFGLAQFSAGNDEMPLLVFGSDVSNGVLLINLVWSLH